MAVSPPVVVLAGLTYGLLADAPQPTFDEALARAEAVPAPGFELAVLHEGAWARGCPARSGRRSPIGDWIAVSCAGRPWWSTSGPRGVTLAGREAPLLERAWQKA